MATEVRRSNGTRLDASLGITERIAPSMTAWTGDMRKRYTDFQVYEINKDGSVLHLKQTRLPEPPREPTPPPPAPEEKKNAEEEGEERNKNEEKGDENGDASSEKPAVPEVPAEDLAALASLTTEDFANSLLAMYHAAATDKNAKTDPETSPVIDDKEKRAQLHQQVRRIFRSAIDTTTDPTGAVVARVLPPRGQGKGVRGGGRDGKNNDNQKRRQPKVRAPGEGEYLHFTLYKENRDTMDALHQIAKALRIKPQAIGTAGTKDRRAATTQRCSVRYQRADALARANPRLHGVTTGDYAYATTPIHLGAHAGNEFVIALKDCLVADSPDLSHAERHARIHASVEAAMASMHTRGWVNYFGHQRFGTHAVGTHEVGRLILQEDFEGAVNAILRYDEDIAKRAEGGEIPAEGHARDDFNRHRACMVFCTGGSMDEALRHLPRRFNAESSLIRHLGRPNATSRRDFIGALTSITRGLRSMYLHAYQSYVWNHAASHRWRLYGDKVVEGDLVLTSSSKPRTADDINNNNPENTAAGDDNAAAAAADDDDEAADARALTAEEADSGKHTIHDVVLPSPGHAVIYPANAVGDFYAAFMRDNGGLDPAKMVRRHREFSLPGAYRKLTARFLAQPTFEVREYTDDNEQMHPTDMALIRAARGESTHQPSRKRGREEHQHQHQHQQQETGEDGGASKKVKLEASPQEVEAAAVAPAAAEDAATSDAKHAEAETCTEEVRAKEAGPPGSDEEEKKEKKTAVVVTFQLPKSAYATVALRELMGVDESEVAAPAAAAAAPAPAKSS